MAVVVTRRLFPILGLLLAASPAAAQWITGGGASGNFNLGPGFTNSVGTANAGNQTIVSGQKLYSQTTPVLVTANCTLDLGGASGCQTNAGIDSGAIIIPNAASLTITLPLSATSGTAGRVYNLGNNGFSYSVVVSGGSQVIKGCTGSGSNSLAVPANTGVVLIDMGSTTSPSYTCYLFGTSGATSQPPVQLNPGTHTVTTGEWNLGTIFVCNTSGCVLTLPAASSLSASTPGIGLKTIGVTATVTATGTDVIDNGQVGGGTAGGSVIFPADLEATMTTSGTAGTTAFNLPLGPVQYFPFTWMPGQNLAVPAGGARVGRFATPRIVYGVRCENDALAGGTATIDFYSVVASGAINTGTKINSSSFDANASNLTEVNVPLTTTPTLVPAAYWVGFVAAGAGWSASTGAGGCQFTYR